MSGKSNKRFNPYNFRSVELHHFAQNGTDDFRNNFVAFNEITNQRQNQVNGFYYVVSFFSAIELFRLRLIRDKLYWCELQFDLKSACGRPTEFFSTSFPFLFCKPCVR